jgi:tetratricopeptide (TPR) repeat protein
MEQQMFTIQPEAFDTSLLPAQARVPGTPEFREAVNAFLLNAFKGFGGQASVMVSDEQIAVSWNPEPTRAGPLQFIVGKLQQGERAEGIQLLNLLLTREPDNVDVLYNLGMALSDAGKLDLAETHLRRAVELSPDFANALVALGIALARQQRDAEAKTFLERAVMLEPNNLWVRRNLGVILIKQREHEEAAQHLQMAVKLQPGDQGSWLALGDAYRLSGQSSKAQEAYKRAVALNPHNDLAEAAMKGSSQLAGATFQSKTGGQPRPDAIEYCAAAIKRFSGMSQEEVKKIGAEIAILGRSGFDVNNPAKRYQLKSMEGDFSGLQLVCHMYVAFQMIAPGADVGFDLSREYEMAKAGF